MIQLHVDGADVVLDGGAVLGRYAAQGDQQGAHQGGQAHPRVPGLEVGLVRDLLVEINGGESARGPKQGKCV